MLDAEQSEHAEGSERGSAAADHEDIQEHHSGEPEHSEQQDQDSLEPGEVAASPEAAGAIDAGAAGAEATHSPDADNNAVNGSAVEQNAPGQEAGALGPEETGYQGPEAKNVAPSGDDLDQLSAEELRTMIRRMRTEHAEHLDTEARARAEVEDMCLRIEKHFTAEKAARDKAEELMQQAIEGELAAKQQLVMEQQRSRDMDGEIEIDREKLRNERDALETMRLDFEQELQQAQAEVSKAQDALKTAEDRVCAAEQVEKQKIIADYEQRIMAMTAEMIRMREDMHQRTVYMTREMQRYQAAAIGTSQAMMAAKKEMQDRRNDIDTMRAKLDAVMERLYVGEGHNLTLQATIATAQDHAGQLFVDPYLATMARNGSFAAGTLALPAPMAGAPALPVTNNAQASRNIKAGAAHGNAPGNLPSVAANRGQGAKSKAKSSGMPSKVQQPPVGSRSFQDRFRSSQAKNEYLMASQMAQW